MLRGLAGQRDDPADLLGGDPGRSPGSRGVGQSLLHAQFLQGDRLEGHPAGAPEPDGIEGHGAVPSDPGIAQAVGGGQDDAGAEGDLLGRGMTPQEGLEVVVLLVGQLNGEGLGSAQDLVRREKRGVQDAVRFRWNYIDESIQPGCTRALHARVGHITGAKAGFFGLNLETCIHSDCEAL